MLLTLGSCEKDSFLPDLVEKVTFNSPPESTQQTQIAYLVASESLQQSIKANLLYKTDKKSGDKTAFSAILDTILASPTSKISSDTLDYDTYSYFVPTEDPTHVINAIFSVEDDILTGGYVHVYRMTSEFAAAFNSFSVDFSEFEGELSIRPLSSLEEIIYEPGQKNGDEDCFTYILSLDPKNPDGGSGGSVSGGNDGPLGGTNGPIGGSTYSGGGNDPLCIYVYEITCNCQGHGVDDVCNCPHQPSLVASTGPCYSLNPDDFSDDSSTAPSNNKDLSINDCTRLFASVGIVPRRLSLPDASEKTLEQISAAIAETCFDENAVMNMIAPTAFEACYAAGTEGATCITNQVINYLNNLNYEELIIAPGTALTYTPSFNSISHDHLSTFLNAGVTANGNEHVLTGMAYARWKLNNPVISANLADQILYLSILHQELDDPDDFVASAGDYLDIVENLNDDATNDLLNSLVRNPTTISTVSEFFSENNYDEFAKNTVLLFASELASGIAYEEVGTEARDIILLENTSSFESAISITTGAECCDDLFIPTSPGDNTYTAIEFLGWHANRFEEEVALLKYIYPEKYPLDTWQNRLKLKLDAEYRVMSAQLHLTLDLLGLIPGVGAVPDVINGFWYTIEGDGLNATMSYAAAIPAVGLLIAGKKIIKWIKFGTKTRRLSWVRHSDGTIFFLPLKTSSWRKFWDFPAGVVGHHMIPKSLASSHPLLQKAANVTEEGAKAFHPHDLANGYPLDPARHIGNHQTYTNNIISELNRWDRAFSGATAEQAATAIKTWQDEIRDLLTLSTGSIDDLILPSIPDPL